MTAPPTDRVRLPLRFDAPAMAAEALALPDDAWARHFNDRVYDGDWSGVALRAVAGGHTPLYSDPTAEVFADTPALAACPRIAEALTLLPCPLTSARLLRLAPGARIREHRDHRLSRADGEARLHIPLLTNPAVTFTLDGRPVDMRPGQCWYLDLTRPHAALNGGATPRIHLVVDCVVDTWLGTLIDSSARTMESEGAEGVSSPVGASGCQGGSG